MTGSVAEGEDVVQETLARAYYELSQQKEMPPLRPWLFRIAHNRAIDHHRREVHRASEPLEAAFELADEAAREPDHVLARSQAVQAALWCFLVLPPAQRGCVILKDVLDHTLEEIAVELELSLPAVKAALHRGRAGLRERCEAPPPAAQPSAASPALARYATLFNAHDWDGVRALLADDVRLDLVSRSKANGRRAVGQYFSNYERLGDVRLQPAWLDGREVLAVTVTGGSVTPPAYFIALRWREGQVTEIQDFRYVPYIAQEGGLRLTV